MWRKAVAAALWAALMLGAVRPAAAGTSGTPGASEVSARSALIGAVRQGRGLTREQAAELEAALVADPAASAARAKLLGYYFHRAPDQIGVAPAIEARRRHVLWLVRHDPASVLGQVGEALISPKGPVLADPAGFAQGREAWLAQVDSRPDDTAVRFNAFVFLMFHDRVAAERLAVQGRERHGSDLTWDSGLGTLYAFAILGIDGTNVNGLPTSVDLAAQDDAFARRAIAVLKASTNPALVGAAGAHLALWGPLIWKMKPGALDRSELAESLLVRAQAMDARNPAWDRSLAEFYEFRSRAAPTPAERAHWSAKALEQRDRSLRLSSDAATRAGQLSETAKTALRADAPQRAEQAAREALELAGPHRADPRFGPALHDAHMVLGRIALRRGDVEQAKAHLADSARIAGGGTLSSFGPNLGLARDLLERGERAAVLDYLEACRKFWTYPRSPLERWIRELREGGRADLSSQPDY